MNYPRIYSLSTVGILKHYNQDYLFHSQRTDFTGSNGVGKSIIADLLQLIFVNEKHLVQFGTESYKKEDRLMTNLAYGCRDAYAFLSVEVEAGKFICIGVCIPNASNRPLKPFVITSSPNKEVPFSERTFPVAQRPLSRSFVNGDKICTIDELAKHFRDRYGLYFESYSNREQKDDHYARLFDQHIMPINLSVPSSLKAYAKIIQSFSRARSAGDKTEELKDFLFDGVDKDFEQSFENHKNDIDRLLTDYDQLLVFITDLDRKQSQLAELSRLETVQLESKKQYMIANCGYHFGHSNETGRKAASKADELGTVTGKIKKIAFELPRYRVLASHYGLIHKKGTEQLDYIKRCYNLRDKIERLESRISALALQNAEMIDETCEAAHLITDYSDSEILRRCRQLIPIYFTYGSMSEIESTVEKQKYTLKSRKDALEQLIGYLENVNGLISGSGTNSLIAKVLQSNQSITPAQEAILFHLLSTHWGSLEDEKFSYYADSFDFFDERFIREDTKWGGYWLELKHLNMFVPKLEREPILHDPAIRQTAITELINNHKVTISLAKDELAEINKFERGVAFDPLLAKVLSDLDPALYSFGVFADLKISCQLAQQLGPFIKSLEEEKGLLEGEKAVLLREAGLDSDTNLNAMQHLLESWDHHWAYRAKKYEQRVTNDLAEERILRENTLPALEQQVADTGKLAADALEDFNNYQADLIAAYPGLEITVEETSGEVLQQSRTAYENAMRNYQSEYKTASKFFLDSEDGGNAEVATEILQERYSFPLLEKALLGPKIRYFDRISEELHTANQSRYKLIDSIYETMLKIFLKTKTRYDEYHAQIRELNLFFKGRKISNKYYFQVKFKANEDIPIEWITKLQGQSQHLHRPGELTIGDSVESFIEDFFKRAYSYRKKITFRELLDPKTYFTLDAGLTDESGKPTSGSTGETYSAKVLLGIGRLSKFQSENRPGIRFIILEETANLDKTNFNNFPEIAEEFGYQIITMTPRPFGSDATTGWYLHHLLAGKVDNNINYPIPASFFKTNTDRKELETYIKSQENELDSVESTA
ncbi:MAG: hypothetical protein ACLGH8_14735 [Bacteroidia bacterium]